MVNADGLEGATFNNGLYGDAPRERSTFFRIELYQRVWISRVEVQKRVRKTFIRCFKGSNE